MNILHYISLLMIVIPFIYLLINHLLDDLTLDIVLFNVIVIIVGISCFVYQYFK